MMLLMTYCSMVMVKAAVERVCNNMHVCERIVWCSVKQKGRNVFCLLLNSMRQGLLLDPLLSLFG